MKKITKEHLKFCATNSAIVFAFASLLITKLKDEGYEIITNKNSNKIMDIYSLIIMLLLPVLNTMISVGIFTSVFNDEMYDLLKQKLLEKGSIKKIDYSELENEKKYNYSIKKRK